jgi:hypothetical protein
VADTLDCTIAALHLQGCAPLLVLHGADDDVVVPLCAEQLTTQAAHVLQRLPGGLIEQPLTDGREYRAGGRPVLRLRLLPGLGHAWSGARGGHPHVLAAGPPLADLALGFLRETGVLTAA